MSSPAAAAAAAAATPAAPPPPPPAAAAEANPFAAEWAAAQKKTKCAIQNSKSRALFCLKKKLALK